MEEMRVYHLGYSSPNSEQLLQSLMQDPAMLIIDTRHKPWSWRSAWCKNDQVKAGLRIPGLQSQWGKRYRDAGKVLGNENHKGGPIKITDLEKGIEGLRYYLVRGYSLILLCQCSHDGCHRYTIMRELKRVMPEVQFYQANGTPELALAS